MPRWISRIRLGLECGWIVSVAISIGWFFLEVNVLPSNMQSEWMSLLYIEQVASIGGSVVGGLAAPLFLPFANNRRDAIHWASIYGGFIAACIAIGVSVIPGVLATIFQFSDADLLVAGV